MDGKHVRTLVRRPRIPKEFFIAALNFAVQPLIFCPIICIGNRPEHGGASVQKPTRPSICNIAAHRYHRSIEIGLEVNM